MRLIYIALALALLMASVALAQRTRPGTDVQTGDETYVFGTVQDNAIILYAIYNATTNAIRGYALWNDTETTAEAQLEFVSGDPINLVASPGTRAAEAVVTRGYVMSTHPTEGYSYDANVSRHRLGNSDHVDLAARPDRSFPLPTERGTR